MYLCNKKIGCFSILVTIVFCNLIFFAKAQQHRHGSFGKERYGPIRNFGNEPSLQQPKPHNNNNNNNNNYHFTVQNNDASQTISASNCKLPIFSDSAQFYLDECQQGNDNNEHPVCQGQMDQRIPPSWKGTMMCTSRTTSIKFSSTCTQYGEWNPPLFKDCGELFQTFQETPQKEPTNQFQGSNSPFFSSPSSSFDSGLNIQEQNLDQEQDNNKREGWNAQSSASPNTKHQVISEVTDTRESLPCFQLKVKMDERFVFSCIFPGHHQESQCISLKMVDHGTTAILKCKRPYKSVNGRPNSWMCINGVWKGEANQIVCTYSPPQVEIPLKNVQNLNSNQKQQNPQLGPSSNGNHFNVPSNKIPTSPVYTEPQSSVFKPQNINSNTRTTTFTPLVLPIDIRKNVHQDDNNNNSSSSNYYIPASTNSKLGGSINTSPKQETFTSSHLNNNNSKKNDNRKITSTSNSPSSSVGYNSKIHPGSQNNIQFVQPPARPVPTFPARPSDNQHNEQTQYDSDQKKSAVIVPTYQTENNNDNNNKKQSTIMCPALRKPPGVKIECVFKQHFVSTTSCESFVPVNTEARYYCDDFYETAVGLTTLFRKCKEDGTWTGTSEQFTCIVQCGKSNIVRVPYITHGSPSVRGQWPWNAGLFLNEELSSQTSSSSKFTFICGGTLISDRVLLTAAHCVTISETTTKREASTLRVDLGKYFRETVDEIVQSRTVQKIVVHPSYSPYGYDSDIAILILEEPIKITYHVQPICFPQSTETAIEELLLSPSSFGTVLGWGRDETGRLSDKLQMTRLPVVSPRDCLDNIKDALTTELQTRSTTFCAGFKNGTNVCNGDSGAGMFFPASVNGQTRWYLQGIVSIGIPKEDGQCDPTKYAVFTRVGRFADFILRTLSENLK